MTTEEIPQKSTILTKEEKDEYVKEALEVHGSFFHIKCIEQISKENGFSVTKKEFPVWYENEHTHVDIVATLSNKPEDTHCIFECKKVDNNFKTWVFFIDQSYHENDESSLKIRVPGEDQLPFIIPTIFNNDGYQTIVKSFFYPKDKNSKDVHPIHCWDGYAIKLDYDKEGKINKSNISKSANKNSIETACHQAILSSLGYAQSRLGKSKYNSRFIPIVLTSAELTSCQIKPEDIDFKDGIIKGNTSVKIKPENWIIYNYKPSIRDIDKIKLIAPNGLNVAWINDTIDYTISVVIVNSEHLKEFLEAVRWA